MASRSKSTVVQLRRHARPTPPKDLFSADDPSGRFIPSAQLATWLHDVFIDEDGPLHNPEHCHLGAASIGVPWTNVNKARAGRRIIGQAEFGQPAGATGRWAKARAEQ